MAVPVARGAILQKSLFASEQDRPWIARRRAQWKKYQGRLDPKRLVFIDETWAKTNMTRTHGRSPRGERLIAKVPQGKWKTLTFLAALRHDRIDAPCVLDGPINGEYHPDNGGCKYFRSKVGLTVPAMALEALQHGFAPSVVSDACADRHPDPHAANLFDLHARYAEVIDSAQAIELLGR